MRSVTSVLLAGSSLALLAGAPAYAQDTRDSDAGPATSAYSDSDAIIVTARRVEERLLDVPVSISVLQSEEISRNNIVSSSDIANYTPNLSVNRRFGDEGTSFVIRGFQQENGTSATVGVYFADVVALRAGGEPSNGGDGAGPGALFDLENIQVLKGPQGTLFGRNSTGGAVLFVPTKPKADFDGYVEGSAGDYGMYRIQGAVNVPFGDSFRMRVSGDHMKRDGYLKNLGFPGKTGRKNFGDVNYYSLRVSAVADLSPDVENYTIVTYTNSDNNGAVPAVKDCNANAVLPIGGGNTLPLGQWACAQVAREAAAGTGYWTVANSTPETYVKSKTWQIINTTTWQISDNVEFKNIFSYGELRSANAIDYFGTYWPIVPVNQVDGPEDVNTFVPNNPAQPYGWNNQQSTLVEEMRLSGRAFGERLDWQAGLYYELSEPLGTSGQQYGQLTPCVDLTALNCRPTAANASLGLLIYNVYRSKFRGMAGYAQGSYHVTDELTLTAGVRYTDDKVWKEFSRNSRPATGMPAIPDAASLVWQSETTGSHKPTWLLGVEYKPIRDMMIYAKYARGYRQGNINASASAGLRVFGPEQVDSYEGGVKAEWRGAVPGRFSVSGFYNDFSDQQLQVRLECSTNPGCPVATATVNVGKSRLYGLEADLLVEPFDGLELIASYGYLNTKITAAQSINPVGQYDTATQIPVGERLPYAPEHSFTGSVKYTLPLPESIGEISIGGTLIYSGSYIAGYTPLQANRPSPITGSTNYLFVPDYTYGNVNVSWEGIGGMPVDASVFVTNVTNEKMFVAPNDQFARGFVSYYLSPPRMWGARLKYRFGASAD